MNNNKTFAGIPEEYANLETAKITLTSIPYDGTSTWGKGADKGFDAFLENGGLCEMDVLLKRSNSVSFGR